MTEEEKAVEVLNI